MILINDGEQMKHPLDTISDTKGDDSTLQVLQNQTKDIYKKEEFESIVDAKKVKTKK